MTSISNVNFVGLSIALINKVDGSKPIIQRLLDKPAKLNSRPGNFLVCPVSFETVLAVAQIGARGKTSKEISTALQLPHEPSRIQLAFLELSQYFQPSEKYYLKTINKIFVKDGSKIDNQFRIAANTFFGSNIQDVNFQKPDEAANIINKWITQSTKNKMNNVFDKTSIDETTRLIVINSTLFRGKCSKFFSYEDTNKKPFFLNVEDYIDIIMLESMGHFNYHDDRRLQTRFLEIPYEGDEIVTTIVLPHKKDGLSKLEDNIAESFEQPDYRLVPVHVRVPKSVVHSAVLFNAILRGMGVKDALEENADFSGIFDGNERLKIDNVLHKTIIDLERIDRKDKSKIKVPEITLPSHPSPTPGSLLAPIKFYADHPFLYYLKHRVTGIFFVGRFYTIDGLVKTVKNKKTVIKNVHK